MARVCAYPAYTLQEVSDSFLFIFIIATALFFVHFHRRDSAFFYLLSSSTALSPVYFHRRDIATALSEKRLAF